MMKKSLSFLLALMLAALAGLAQESWVVISPNPQMELYLGMPNELSIAVDRVPRSELNYSCTNGRITVLDGIASIYPDSIGKVEVSVLRSKKLLKTLTYKVVYVPNPRVTIDIPGASATVSARCLAMSHGLVVSILHYNGAPFVVRKYVMTTKDAAGMAISFTAKNEELTPEMKGAIRRCKPGQIVSFENIEVVGKDGTVRKLSPLKYTIR